MKGLEWLGNCERCGLQTQILFAFKSVIFFFFSVIVFAAVATTMVCKQRTCEKINRSLVNLLLRQITFHLYQTQFSE